MRSMRGPTRLVGRVCSVVAFTCLAILATQVLAGGVSTPPSGDSAVADSRALVHLHVRVLESDGREPIKGAVVKIAGTAQGSVTGPPGLVVIPNVAPGPVGLYIYFYDGATLDTTLLVAPSDTTFSILAPPRPGHWVIDRDPTGFGWTDLFVSVRSRATDRPVKGVAVYVNDAYGRTRQAIANRRGRAFFKQVRGRDVRVWTRDTLGFQGGERFMTLMEVHATRDTLRIAPLPRSR